MPKVHPELFALLYARFDQGELFRALEREDWAVDLVRLLSPVEHANPDLWFQSLVRLAEQRDELPELLAVMRTLRPKRVAEIDAVGRLLKKGAAPAPKADPAPPAPKVTPASGAHEGRQAPTAKVAPAEAPPAWRPVRVLHLSDLHFSAKVAWDQMPVLTELVKEVNALRAELGPLHRVVITGDIANFGSAKEYAKAAAWLNGPLGEAAGVKADQIRMVPGNHDVDRPKVNLAVSGLDEKVLSKGGDDTIAKLMSDKALRKMLLDRQAAYRKFAKGFNPHDDSPGWRSEEEIEGWAIHFIGINTAWLSGSHKNDRGEVDDHRHLAIGGWQWNALFPAGRPDAGLTIALMHHPWEDLSERESRAHREATYDRCAVILRGHLHDVDTLSAKRDGKLVLEAAAAACYAPPSEGWPHGFQLLELDPGLGLAKVHLRKWHSKTKRWIPDRERYPETGPNGLVELELRRSPHKPDVPPPQSDRRDSENFERYLKYVHSSLPRLPKPFSTPQGAQYSLNVERKLRGDNVCSPSTLQETLRSLPKERPVLIRGPAGSGKTYMLMQLILGILSDSTGERLVPIYLRYSEILAGLEKAVKAVGSRSDLGDWPWEVVRRGAAVVMIDDVPPGSDDQVLLDTIAGAVIQSRESRVIVACRDSTDIEATGAFYRLDLEGMDDEERRSILNYWLADDRLSAEVVRQIESDAKLLHFLDSPLTLSLIARFDYSHGVADLPQSRVKLYESYLRALLRQDHHRSGVGDARKLTEADVENATHVLAFIALLVHLNNGECVLLDCQRKLEASDTFYRRLLQVMKGLGVEENIFETFLDVVHERTGLVVVDIVRPGAAAKVRIASPAMEEYLVAIALANNTEMTEWLLNGTNGQISDAIRQHPERWAEVLALFACGTTWDAHRVLLRVASLREPKLTRAIICRMEQLNAAVCSAYLNHSLAIAAESPERSQYLAILASSDTADDKIDLLLRMVKFQTGGDSRYWIFHALQRLASSSNLSAQVQRRSRVAAQLVATGFRRQDRDAALSKLEEQSWTTIDCADVTTTSPHGDPPPRWSSNPVEASALITNGIFRHFEPHAVLTGEDDEPATNVSWCQAVMFSMWLTMRLPSVAECQAILRLHAPPSGSMKQVGEWTLEVYRDYPSERVKFDDGGPWEGCGEDTRIYLLWKHEAQAGCASDPARMGAWAEDRRAYIGFRVLRSRSPGH